MRLFVAIELDEEARRRIGAEEKRLQQVLGSRDRSTLKWVRPEHMHLTLVFLGELSEDRTGIIVEAMTRPIEGQRFGVGFGGFGVFPARGAPRVLWLGVMRGGQEVAAVQRQVVERVERLGIGLENRAFHPHLTLARWRAAVYADRHGVLASAGQQEVAGIDVDAVTLVESRLSSAGPTYRALCRARLGGDTRPTLQSER